MKPIVILSTPRCGTNLLMLSLANHSRAVCAGEVCNAEANPDVWGVSDDRAPLIRRCNVFKVLSVHRSHWDYGQFLGWGFRVYLYRRDVAAQTRSWVTAATTGVWMAGQQRPHVATPPTIEHVQSELAYADRVLMRQSDMVLSYEQMVAHWDATIESILRLAGWRLETLAMATQPTAAGTGKP